VLKYGDEMELTGISTYLGHVVKRHLWLKSVMVKFNWQYFC